MTMLRTRKDEATMEGQKTKTDDIVKRYQNGDEGAGMALLKEYGYDPESGEVYAYIGKYFKMMRFGRMDFKNYDSRAFISLFFSDAEGKEMRKSYQYMETKVKMRKKLQQIEKVMRSVPDDDIIQELIHILLVQAKKYRPKKRSFGAYLKNSFRYRLNDYVLKYMKSEDIFDNTDIEVAGIGEDVAEDVESIIDPEDFTWDALKIQHEDELGNAWVRGIHCSGRFKDMTPLQRLILRMNYMEKLSDREIADAMGMHINTIFRQRTNAKRMLEGQQGGTKNGEDCAVHGLQ